MLLCKIWAIKMPLWSFLFLSSYNLIAINIERYISIIAPISVADLRGGVRDARPPPLRPNSFNFMQFLGEFGKIACSRPPLGGFTPPPWGNPGSVTGFTTKLRYVQLQQNKHQKPFNLKVSSFKPIR